MEFYEFLGIPDSVHPFVYSFIRLSFLLGSWEFRLLHNGHLALIYPSLSFIYSFIHSFIRSFVYLPPLFVEILGIPIARQRAPCTDISVPMVHPFIHSSIGCFVGQFRVAVS